MNHQHGLDEVTGWITGFSVYILTHFFHFKLLQIQQQPILSFFLIKAVSLVFAALSAIVAYLAVYYTKKYLKH